MKIIKLDTVDSTNEFCKRYKGDGDIIVIADRQSAGRGTKGRSFSSAAGGLYISTLKRHAGYPAADAFKIMVNSCVAVCKTLECFGVKPCVRWANDVLVNGKKICGTLIENIFSGGKITRSIAGMGININNDLPEDIKDIAISLKQATGKEQSLAEVEKIFINFLQNNYEISDYKKYIDYFGRQVLLKTEDGEIICTALDIDGTGRLIVERGGEILKISAAEVSLRL